MCLISLIIACWQACSLFVFNHTPNYTNVSLLQTISQRVLFEQEPVPGVSVQVTPTFCPTPGV